MKLRRAVALTAVLVGAAALLIGAGPLPVGAQGTTGVNPVTAPVLDRQLDVHLREFAVLPPPSSEYRVGVVAMVTGADDRMYAVSGREGLIYEFEDGSTSRWFDVDAALQTATGAELHRHNLRQSGVRSLAFHPDFANNRKIYTSQVEVRPLSNSGLDYLSDALGALVDNTVIEWTVGADGRPDPSSHREVLRVGSPSPNHPIKQIMFDPTLSLGAPGFGALYVAIGDGQWNHIIGLGGHGNDALGKILRIDPRQTPTGSYSVPADNPFVGDPSMLDEVWSRGHRNPHHLAFADDGTLLVADAGHDNVEEINVVQPGADYGWPHREGTFVHLLGGGLINGVTPLPANDAAWEYTYPAAQVGHSGSAGQGFTGHVLAGGRVIENGSPLSGEYFYAELGVFSDLYHSSLSELQAAVTSGSPAGLTQASTARAAIWFDHDDNPNTAALARESLIDVFAESPSYDRSGRGDLRFGQGPDGEMYISSKRNRTIYLVTSSVPDGPGGFVVRCEGLVATHTGTGGPDVISGTAGDDVIVGGAGDDTIAGGGGDDVICGGDGDDLIWGQAGDDYLSGGAGDDRLRGGDDDDVLRGGDGVDDLAGGRHNDRVHGDAGNDVKVRGGTGDDHVDGGAGNDVLVAGNGGSDTVTGGPGDDEKVTGGPRPDLVRGGAGDDFVRGNKGADRLFGDAGNDQLLSGAQPDVIDGGPGNDLCNGGLGIEDLAAVTSCEALTNIP